MRYRNIIQVRIVMAMFSSGPTSAQAVFPETEFSQGATEPRRPWHVARGATTHAGAS